MERRFILVLPPHWRPKLSGEAIHAIVEVFVIALQEGLDWVDVLYVLVVLLQQPLVSLLRILRDARSESQFLGGVVHLPLEALQLLLAARQLVRDAVEERGLLLRTHLRLLRFSIANRVTRGWVDAVALQHPHVLFEQLAPVLLHFLAPPRVLNTAAEKLTPHFAPRHFRTVLNAAVGAGFPFLLEFIVALLRCNYTVRANETNN